MLASRRHAQDFQLSSKRARSRRLGRLAFSAFRRFVQLYRKYDPDQPRDERGRWTETGAGDDVDATGSTTRIDNSVRTGDREIDSITQKLAEKLADVVDLVGDGRGPLYGTRIHAAFAESVRNSGIPGLTVETPWLNGEMLPGYSITGSVRADVVFRSADDLAPVRAIWDVKTGNATLGPARLDQLRLQIGVGRDVPVIELSIPRGVMLKHATNLRLLGAPS